MKTSDVIGAFISDMLERSGGMVELQRNELAQKFQVVPSQINYVITSRFSPEQGYIIESHRGGGGYIRIKRVQFTDEATHIMHIVNSIGRELTRFDCRLFLRNLHDYGYLNDDEHKLMNAATSDTALGTIPAQERDAARAQIMKTVLMVIRG